MTAVLISIAILAVLGALFGVGLAIAARAFHVETDPRLQEVSEALPGINCGACGHPGCDGYAAAVVEGAAPDLCVPGGPSVAAAVAAIMGEEVDTDRKPMKAFVRCQGDRESAPTRFDYDGLPDCQAAQLIMGGAKACEYGCLGYGSCAAACPFDAITMSDEGLPLADLDRCTGCGACVRQCPRGIITLVPEDAVVGLACNNPLKGKATKGVCEYVCIKCRKCVKACAEGAVEMGDRTPVLRYDVEPSPDFTPALETCPKHCFVTIERKGVTRSVPEKAAVG